MADEPQSALKIVADVSTKSDFSNVEFLESSLADPVNVLRAKLKELAELPDSILVRRVIILTDLITEEGRGLDIVWSEGAEESPYAIHDSVISMLTRVKNAIAGSGD